MIMKQFRADKLSALGLGCMRFPLVEGTENVIDESATAEMFDWAMEHGINYYDTAWPYHSEQSEIITGKLLRRYPRDSYRIATKFPGFETEYFEQGEAIFEKQLEKTGMEYFDYYLLHNICESNIDNFLSEQYGILPMLLKKKAEGKIRHLGFSTHGSLQNMEQFLNACGEHMEFCQIQLNWLDWELQDAKAKVELLKKYNMPIWVMEPVRGGKLANLSAEAEQTLKALRPDTTIPAWSFRFLQNIPEVTMVLSGMSNMEQLQDNVNTYQTEEPLNEQEWNALQEIAKGMVGGVPCTTCRYCVDSCPQNLDIPLLLRYYNEQNYNGSKQAPLALRSMPEEKHPSACVGCRTCEDKCPQNIKIADIMKDHASKMFAPVEE